MSDQTDPASVDWKEFAQAYNRVGELLSMTAAACVEAVLLAFQQIWDGIYPVDDSIEPQSTNCLAKGVISMSEIITFTTVGSVAGIPGVHGPGTYEVDYEARTIKPVVPVQPQEAQQSAAQPEAVQPPAQEATQPTETPLQEEIAHLEEEVQTLASETTNQVQ